MFVCRFGFSWKNFLSQYYDRKHERKFLFVDVEDCEFKEERDKFLPSFQSWKSVLGYQLFGRKFVEQLFLKRKQTEQIIAPRSPLD